MAVYPGQDGRISYKYLWSGVEADSIVFQLAPADALLEQALVCDLDSGTQQLATQESQVDGAETASTRPGRRHGCRCFVPVPTYTNT